jgi:hypothetical protein
MTIKVKNMDKLPPWGTGGTNMRLTDTALHYATYIPNNIAVQEICYYTLCVGVLMRIQRRLPS